MSRSVWWANVCLLAASEPVNHYGLRKRLRPTFHLLHPPIPPSPFNPFTGSLSLSLFHARESLASLSVSSFTLVLSFLFSSLLVSSLSVAFSPARSSPSFPSVASSPRCSVLQARYNAARRRPYCIFKRAVLLCSRYHPRH